MSKYIDREAAIEICETEYQARLRMCDYCGDTVAWNIGGKIKALPAADVAPVVRCKDCEYSDDEISYLCCTHGVCADCEVPPNFYCAEGKRKDGDDDAKEN